jgi:4'-phosphopantetheinyl transferase EntD
LEYAAALPDGVPSLVCGPDELASHASWMLTDTANLLFVIKEAVYKLYFPICNHFLDFLDVTVRLESCGTRFTAKIAPNHPALSGSHLIGGLWGQVDGHLIATALAAR